MTRERGGADAVLKCQIGDGHIDNIRLHVGAPAGGDFSRHRANESKDNSDIVRCKTP